MADVPQDFSERWVVDANEVIVQHRGRLSNCPIPHVEPPTALLYLLLSSRSGQMEILVRLRIRVRRIWVRVGTCGPMLGGPMNVA